MEGEKSGVSVQNYESHPYASTENIFRQAVPDEKVDWQNPYPGYNPPDYTAKSVLNNPPWADADDPALYTFNVEEGSVNRTSYVSQYSLDDKGRPMNPMGRTGLAGRGLLGKWGPNHAADALVSRFWNGQLQYVGIKRKDNGLWAMPGGMIDNGEDEQSCSIREFTEEALNNTPNRSLAPLWKTGQLVYQGYVDDNRNTDNSWMETTVFNYHDTEGLFDNIRLQASDDATDVRWITVQPNVQKDTTVFPSHTNIIKLFAKKHGIKF